MTMSSTTMNGRASSPFGMLLRIAVLTALMVFGICYTKPALASAALIAASNTANAGLNACSSQQGKALYNCVADVLDRLSGDIAPYRVGETQRSLQTAAAGLRAANTKGEALSAVRQCQAVVLGALRKVRAIAGAISGEGGGDGLQAVAGVLARAVRLIQTKG